MTPRQASLLPSLLFLLPLAGSPPLAAEDWPQWRGPQRDGHAPAEWKTPNTLRAEPNVIWKIPTGPSIASPIVSAGRVFHGDAQDGKEVLHCLDASDGRELWHAVIDDPTQDSQGPAGPRCTPVADGDRVYAQSCRGELQCLRAATGSLVWRINYVRDLGAVFIGERGNAAGAARHGNNASPLIDGDHLIACAGGTNGASVVCLDKRTGEVLWKSQNDQAGYAAPFLATIRGTRQVLCFTAEGLLSVARDDGRPLWRVPVKTAFARHVTTPVVLDDMVVIGSHQAGLIGIRVRREGDTFQAERAWTSMEAAPNFSSPVALGRLLLSLSPDKEVIGVDIPTGRILWSKEGYFNTPAPKTHAAFIVMGKRVLLATDGGELVLLEPDSGGCREVARTQVCGQNWTSPAYAAGRLYHRDGINGPGHLICLDLLASP